MGSNGTIDHIGQLTPDPRNVRKHSPRNLAGVERSIGEVGFVSPIVTDNRYGVIVGNLRTEAAANLDMTNVIVVESDGTRPIVHVRTDIDPGSEKAIKAGIYDNRTAELADGWDADNLAWARDQTTIAAVIFAPEEMEVFIAAGSDGDFDPAAHWTGMPEFHQDDLMPVKQIAVNFASESAVDAFARLIEQNVTMSTKSVWYPAVQQMNPDEHRVRYVDRDGDDDA